MSKNYEQQRESDHVPQSIRTKLTVSASLGVVAVLALSSCSSTSSEDSSSASPSPSDASACLIGNWTADMRLLGESAGAVVPGLTNRRAEGLVDVSFTDEILTTTYNATLKGDLPATSTTKPKSISVSMVGGASANYIPTDTTLSTSNSQGSVKVTGSETTDGTRTALTNLVAYQAVAAFTTGTLAYTCSPTSMILTNQSGVSINATRK